MVPYTLLPLHGETKTRPYFDKKDHLPALPGSAGWDLSGNCSLIVWLALQMLDPLSSAENSLSGSCQSLDRSADRYGGVGGLGA